MKTDTNKHTNRQKLICSVTCQDNGLTLRRWDLWWAGSTVGLYLDTTDALLINLGAGYIIVFTLGKVIKLYRYNFCTSLHVILWEGNGTPLQHSCLKNPMDRGAWWASVHGVAKSRTRLSDFPFTFHFPALEKEMATHSSVLTWRIPGTGKPGGLPSMGSHRVGQDWSDLEAAAAAAAAACYSSKKNFF